MTQVGVVADDLTGAADAIAPFANVGMHAHIEMMPDKGCHSAAAIGWNTGSRDAPISDAEVVRRVTEAARRASRVGMRIFYLKVDSTLRGRLRASLEGIRARTSGCLAVVCPAFPANGRMVIDGRVRVGGESRQTVRAAFEFGNDPTAIDLSLTQLRIGSQFLARQLGILHDRGVRALLADAETDSDLDCLAEAVLNSAAPVIPIGSAGLAAALARRIAAPLPGRFSTVHEALSRFRQHPVLALVGSRHDASRAQVRCLIEHAAPACIELDVPGGHISAMVECGLVQNARVVVAISSESDRSAMEWERQAIVGDIAEAARRIDNLGLFVTGGATAARLLSDQPVSRLHIEGEVEAGIVLCRIQTTESTHPLSEKQMILKSGGFGDREAIARILGLRSRAL